MNEQQYPCTRQELSEKIDNLPVVFPDGIVSIPPNDSTIEWESFYSGEEIFNETPDRDIGTNEDGTTNVEVTHHMREQNLTVGEGISIRSVSDAGFRIFDPDNLLSNIIHSNNIHSLKRLVAMIKEFSSRQIDKHSGASQDREAAQKPWIELRDEAIGWQSQHNCLDMDIFTELCDTSEQPETTQTGECWVNNNTWELMFQGDQYELSHREYQIIKLLKYQPNSANGMTTRQLIILFNESYPKPNLTANFHISKTFKKNANLIGTLISNVGPKPFKYSLSVPLVNRQ